MVSSAWCFGATGHLSRLPTTLPSKNPRQMIRRTAGVHRAPAQCRRDHGVSDQLAPEPRNPPFTQHVRARFALQPAPFVKLYFSICFFMSSSSCSLFRLNGPGCKARRLDVGATAPTCPFQGQHPPQTAGRAWRRRPGWPLGCAPLRPPVLARSSSAAPT